MQKIKKPVANIAYSKMRALCLKMKKLQLNKITVGRQESGFEIPHLP